MIYDGLIEIGAISMEAMNAPSACKQQAWQFVVFAKWELLEGITIQF